jgi:hypothetical protein
VGGYCLLEQLCHQELMFVSFIKYVTSILYSRNRFLPVRGSMQCLADYCKVSRQDMQRPKRES